ncbi:MAG: phosphatase domain-containing protein, partial [Parafilimonas sp.]
MSLKSFIFKTLKITDKPVLKMYHGYGNEKQVLIYGHTFKISPLGRKRYRKNFITNLFAVLRLFMVKPYSNATVRLVWQQTEVTAITEDDGFFKLEWNIISPVESGWHQVQADLLSASGEIITSGEGKIYLPYTTQYGCISDIDDTFLISHSSTLLKRLYVLLTENAYTRTPFKGVIDHYQYLAYAATIPEKPNPFFYVSSSEWNLYDYIRDFSEKNNMPPGVYLLAQLKRFNEMFKTGKTKHASKFIRIQRILKDYPKHKFILLGDDSQQDPYIYQDIVKNFPAQIITVYLRRINRKNEQQVQKIVEQLTAAKIECCYFTHSSEAIEHSKK